ncbi:hypothetical protein [Micromonospora sp. WMMD710]|uniref:hypothetical protein n=1 Tax=Micromonospora sp. WMMD710 TaxID=3016085 RepID=UPI002416ADF2|nr:hypothetical protein [Micromonospora sp. WMMD710]MDG4758481.1 hypothetical protein [Micromonospora sp. WMMD710]
MTAVVCRGAPDPAIVDRAPQPPGPGQVRIAVAYTGICGIVPAVGGGWLGR